MIRSWPSSKRNSTKPKTAAVKTDQTLAFFKEVTAKIDEQLVAWYAIVEKDIPTFNDLVREKEVDAVMVE